MVSPCDDGNSAGVGDPGDLAMAAVDQTTPSNPSAGRSAGSPLSRVGLRGRLLAAILLVALTTLAVGIVGVQRMSVLSASAERVYTDGTLPLQELKQLQVDWWTHEAYSARSQIVSAGPEVNAGDAAKAANAEKELAAQIEVVAGLHLTGAVGKNFATFQKDAEQYRKVEQGLQTAFGNHDLGGAVAAISQLQALEKDAVAAINAAATAMEKVAAETASEANSAYVTARTITFTIIGIGLLVSLVLALLIARSVTTPVQRIREVLDKVAGGDLRVRAGRTGGAELGQVAVSVDPPLASVGNVLPLVNAAAPRLAGASSSHNSAAEAIADNARTAAGQADVVASAGD